MTRHPIVVIKLGTSSIVHEETHQPLLSTLALIVETAARLRRDGFKVVIVSSGAIGISLQKMGLAKRPKHLPQVQALAAIGQCRLMGLWEEMFERLGQNIAQILLTRNDIADRTQYLNAQNTFVELLNMGVIPIVNENDTIAVSEIKFGDNDTLSAITAGMVGADYLFLMTDVDCLYDKNPRKFADAKPVEVVEDVFSLAVDVSSAGSALGTGGMSTKLVAARLATAAGVTTIITRSSLPGNIRSIVEHLEAIKAAKKSGNGKDIASLVRPPLHTMFLPAQHRIRDRHFWLLHGLAPHGTVYIDKGATRALSDGRGLLPVGIIDVAGHFAQQECVRIVECEKLASGAVQGGDANFAVTTTAMHSRPSTPDARKELLRGTTIAPIDFPEPHSMTSSTASLHGLPTLRDYRELREVGRALVNYNASEVRRIMGLRSVEIAGALGYADTEYVAFRENVALSPLAPEAAVSLPSTQSGLGGGLGGYVEG